MGVASSDRLVWMDLETTGLDPDRARILEVAVLITDGELDIIAEGPDRVVHQPDGVLEAMDESSRARHTGSGLIDRVRASGLTEAEAEAELLAFVQEHCARGSSPVAGNLVQRDRQFLGRYMPGLDEYLHYRIVDLSSIRELVRRWYPDEFARAPSRTEGHRAIDDIHESLAELRFYRQTIFR